MFRPNLATIYMPIRSQISSVMGQIEPEHTELFAIEFGKIAEYDFVCTLSSTNINQSAPNLVKMYVTIRSRMSSVIEMFQYNGLFHIFQTSRHSPVN